ncbi:FxSxx-COOH system tetratricopeptide repeat protein [Nonomuraea sp. NPDC004186]
MPEWRIEVEASGDRAVSAVEIPGIVTTGDYSPVNNRTIRIEPGTLRASAEVDLTVALTNLHDPPAAVFVGREAVLAQLDHHLSGEQGEVVIGKVIHGLGGIGKTATARRYATARRDRYRLIWWINAEDVEQIQVGLTRLAQCLHPPAGLALTAEQAAGWARGWLEAHDGWLLVLDNVEELAHVRDLLGQLHTGHILITTRRLVRWPAGIQTIRLEVLDASEAAELITATSERNRPEDRPAVDAIAAELGYLPLALEQVGAYIRESKISPGEYLSLLTAHPAHMYAASPEGGDAERTIARLWRVHLHAIRERNTYAVHLLRILACYAPDNIPRDILDVDGDRLGVLDALRLLSSYSLITLEERTVSVHRLIQAVVAAEDETGPTCLVDSASELAIRWLAGAWLASARESPSDRIARRRMLSPHVESLIRYRFISTEPRAHDQIFNAAADHEWDEGNYRRARKLVAHTVAINRVVLGEEHPDTLTSWNNLASVLGRLGRLQEAEAEIRAVLQARRRVLGEEHPGTLTSWNNLASVLGDLGRLQEAEAETRAVLQARRRTLGEEHPETLNSRNNLALVLGDLGRLQEAEAEARAVWQTQARALGEEHPDTLTSRNNLALVLGRLGRLQEAETETRAVLQARRRGLGEEHPNTLTSRNNLAYVLGSLGRLQEAEAETRAVLQARRRVLGEEHPETLNSRSNLAFVLGELGQVEAEAETRAVLQVRRRVLGEEHPSTLNSRNNLAGVLGRLGRLQEAEAETRAVLQARRQVLGDEHPDTLISREYLDYLVREQKLRESAGPQYYPQS